MRGGPFKALERVSVSGFGEEATPRRVCVVSAGRGRRLSAAVTSVSLSVASERAAGTSATGAERECTGPRPHPLPVEAPLGRPLPSQLGHSPPDARVPCRPRPQEMAALPDLPLPFLGLSGPPPPSRTTSPTRFRPLGA